MKYKFICSLFLLFSAVLSAQDTSVQTLDTIYLSDQNLKTFNTGQKQVRLTDSIIQENGFALTDILQRQTPIYFRQNGYGMVASASFRGTTAQQTAVLWNGVNINSSLTGQTDFNTLLSANFTSIDVKFGGGSVVYGTGAIGGSIHLNQNIGKHIEEQHKFRAGFGSFNTLETGYSFQKQVDVLKFKLAFARRQSDNDYDIPSQNRLNENGQFYMNSLDAVVRLDISDHDVLSYFSNFTFGERHFSLVRTSDPRTKYDNVDTRNMIEWQNTSNNIQSKLKIAYLTEEFTFFENLDRDTSSTSEVFTQWLQYELMYSFKAMKLKAILNYQNAQADGNQLVNADRDLAGLSFLFQHELSDHWNYEVTLRQDLNDNYENPFLFSLGSKLNLNKEWAFRIHASKNYRLPTFNDLFWSNSGNPDLNPETAYQTEFGVHYDFNDILSLSLTGYYMDITDMIRWLPNQFGVWQPQNTQDVQTYGGEANMKFNYKFSSQQALEFTSNYAYTISENQATGNQLTYVPFHTANSNFIYKYEDWDFGFTWLYNGSVFTQTDNNPDRRVDGFHLFDAQISKRLPHFFNSKLSLRGLNIFDLAYEAVDNRPMPGRTFMLQLITQF
jgi:iron complex outermembrane receptor protein